MDKADTWRVAHRADDTLIPGRASGGSCSSPVSFSRPTPDKESFRLRRRPSLAALRRSRRAREPVMVRRPGLRRSQSAVLRACQNVRHTHSEYDRLLAKGLERLEARSAVADKVAVVMECWRRRGDHDRSF